MSENNCILLTLGSVYMGGGTGRLPGRDVFYPGFKNCLYGRRDGTGRLPGRLLGRDVFHPGFT